MNTLTPKGLLIPLLIGVSILVITAFHYLTSTEHLLRHEIYQRLYYLPIVYAAYRYGVTGGLIASVLSAIVYAPHIFTDWKGEYEYQLNQNAEIIMFHVVAVVTGLLATAEKRGRLRYERITRELQEAYQELKKAYDRLTRADRLASLGEVSAGIVHEIRTPLASIKGAVEILESPGASEDAKLEFLRIIRREVDRLNGMVGEYLQFARPSPPRRLPTDMNEVVRSVVLLCQKQAANEKIEIRAKLGEPLPEVIVDPEQIKQVLLNIFLNGIQAMPEGGTLDLETLSRDDAVTVRVRDNGRGIEQMHIERVFDPFFTTKQDGTGLGLSIAYRLVKQNEGDLTVSSIPGDGCVFELTLPVGESN